MSENIAESAERDEGGTAFPVPEQFSWSGMSLRDWFAGQALASIAAEWGKRPMETADERGEKQVYLNAAEMAYGFADGMLAWRSK